MKKLLFVIVLLSASSVQAWWWSKAHAVKVLNGTGAGMFKSGDKVPLSAGPCPETFQFAAWFVQPPTGGTFTNPNAPNTVFTMKDVDVEVSATCWKAN